MESSRVAVHPRFEKLYGSESWKAADGLVDLARRRGTVRIREQIVRHELELAARPDPAADGRPEAIHEQPRDTRDGAPLEPQLGLAVVEEELPRLVEHDALEQVGADRMLRH